MHSDYFISPINIFLWSYSQVIGLFITPMAKENQKFTTIAINHIAEKTPGPHALHILSTFQRQLAVQKSTTTQIPAQRVFLLTKEAWSPYLILFLHNQIILLIFAIFKWWKPFWPCSFLWEHVEKANACRFILWCCKR